MKRLLAVSILAVATLCSVRAQVIEFESNGLKYQTLTRSGVTLICAHLPGQISGYSMIQVSVSNGSGAPYTIRPEDFSFMRNDGPPIRAEAAKDVVAMLSKRGSGADVIKLVVTYESSVYGNTHIRSTNGYEQRRLGALAMSSNRLRAAATASAIALVQTKLPPGESTDGAVFFSTAGKPIGPGKLVVKTNTDTFEFLPKAE
jgi:hypothetical protein